ncbi:MAG: hypothetical protein ACHP7N_01420 [Caulobacterales bacterium]
MAEDSEVLERIHKALIAFNKRAEKSSDATLVATFVDSAPLFDLLSTTNNQVIYGRRGTGKTHALKYLAEIVEGRGERAIYLDLRSIGSNGSIYSDGGRAMSERASTLVVDVLGGLYDELYGLTLERIDQHPNPGELTRRLDRLQEALSTIRIAGTAEVEQTDTGSAKESAGLSGKISTGKPVSVDIEARHERERTTETSRRILRSGVELVHLTFGNIAATLGDLIAVLDTPRIWLLIDEWSELPLELQPYLADLLRRILLPINEITVKIAAIEHRSQFVILKERGEYIGLELGADLSADLNLDDFLVFDNSQDKATAFIKALIFRHYTSAEGNPPVFADADSFIHTAFTQYPVFEEFVRAVEGVPRDALNLAAKIATKGYGQRIAMSHVRAAARDWYNQDKAAAIRSSPELGALLDHIVDGVIGKRRARAFLFPSNVRDEGIEKLFDSRLLHILKKNVSSRDEPGKRYDVYKIDYGCYVELINTAGAPEGLFEIEGEGYVDVPRDDYRSIRRAILDPKTLQ